MNASNLCGAMLLAVAGAPAADAGTRVALCLETRVLASHFIVERAKATTARIFSEVGLEMEWVPRQRCEEPGVIRIELDGEAPKSADPKAMAYARPFASGGVGIHVFYDRVLANYPERPWHLLGQVMAHEITHVLQGISRHSDSGLMKACWGMKDYYAMRNRPLPFTAEDIELLHLGLARSARGAANAGRKPE
jgi:hypothetical protein